MFVSGGTQADVLTIAVRESCWGGGIGSALLAALIAAARDHAQDAKRSFAERRRRRRRDDRIGRRDEQRRSDHARSSRQRIPGAPIQRRRSRS
jgi:GNAT superfamily N-acetyltransferase